MALDTGSEGVNARSVCRSRTREAAGARGFDSRQLHGYQ